MKKLVGEGKPFHSAVDKAAGMLKRKVGTGAEFMKELMGVTGIKPTEINERGLTDVMGMPRMTHDQFMANLATRPAPKIREKVLGEQVQDTKVRNQAWDKAYENGIDHYLDNGFTPDHARKLALEYADKYLHKYLPKNVEPEHPTHHGQWTLPGGKNYREMLIKMPNDREKLNSKTVELDTKLRHAAPENRSAIMSQIDELKDQREKTPEVFGGVGNHFGGESGILASMRLKDRTGPNGEKLLHLEELQSDWHQQGREKGYKSNAPEEEVRKAYNAQGYNAVPFDELRPEDRAHEIKKFREQGVPDAPFKKNWEEMALKRLIHHAAEKGYHGVVVTPGAEQADRYNIGNRIGYLGYHPEEERLKAYGHDRREVMNQTGIKKEDLPSHIGKEVADRLLKAPQMLGTHQLEGEDIHVGGEGMKGFYDKKVPNILNSIGKKYGVKTHLGGHRLQGSPEDYGNAVEKLGIAHIPMAQLTPEQNQKIAETADKRLHHFPITEEMRKDVLTNGMPLYNHGGTVHKTEGGSMEPSQDEMKLALTNKKIAVKPAEEKEAPPKYKETANPKRILFPVSNSGAVKGIVVPRHMWEGGEEADGMKEINKARAAVYGSENRDPLSITQVGRIHKQTLDEHFKRPIKEQKKIEMAALKRLRDSRHINHNADTLDASEKLDTVRHEYDKEGRSHVGFASKGVAGHSLYTSGHGSNEVHHVINTCPGQTTGCGGGTDENGIVDTSKGTCFAPNAESQYVNASVRRACHEQAKHDPAMTRDWILAHTRSMRNKVATADSNNERLLFRPNVVDETDVSSRHLIRHLNKQRKLEDKPPIIANSYGKTGELHDPENGYFVTYSNVGPKVKHGASISENIARDKGRIRQTVLAQDAGGKDIVNEDKKKTPPKGSYMVTNVQRGSPMAKKMESTITHAKYWSAGRLPVELSKEEREEGPVGHFDSRGKPTTPDKAHYGHNTLEAENGEKLRFDYQKQHILHPRLVNVPERRKNKETGEMEDVEHMIPTDSRFKDEEFLPKERFKTKNGKDAGPILMTTPTESTSRVGHHTSFTHDVNEKDIEHAKNNNGEYQIDHPAEQMAAKNNEYSPPQVVKIVRKAEGGVVEMEDQDRHGLGHDEFYAFPESNFAAQHHLAYRDDPAEKQKAKSMSLEQFKAQRVLHKAVGGAVNMSNLGVNEAPNMDIKAYFPPGPMTKPGELPMGGIPQPAPQQQPGTPPPGAPQGPQAPQMPGQPPQAPQMGGLPSAPPQGPPMGQPPSNILQMTRQGQAMNAMTPPR